MPADHEPWQLHAWINKVLGGAEKMSPVDSVTVRVLEDVVRDPVGLSCPFAVGDGDAVDFGNAVDFGASGAVFWGLTLDDDDAVDSGFARFLVNASMMVGCCE
jgi:hypothetical protein